MTTVESEQAVEDAILPVIAPADAETVPHPAVAAPADDPPRPSADSAAAEPRQELPNGQSSTAEAQLPPAFRINGWTANPVGAPHSPVTVTSLVVEGTVPGQPAPSPAQDVEPPAGPSAEATLTTATATAPAWGLGAEAALLGRMPKVVQHPWLLGDHFGVSDTELDAARAGAVELRAASIRGLAHRLHGTVRQDSYSLGATRDGNFAVLAVGDGLGSAPLSHRGSRRVTAAVVDWLSRLDAEGLEPWPAQVDRAVGAACGSVRAHMQDHPEQSYSSTLVVAAVAAGDGDGPRKAYLARIGDSTALHVVDGHLVDLFAEPEEAVRSGATACLPLHPESVEVAEVELRPGQALVLATDGFHVPAMTSSSSSHFGERWSQAPGIDELLVDLHFLARTYDDDRTVIGAWVPSRHADGEAS